MKNVKFVKVETEKYDVLIDGEYAGTVVKLQNSHWVILENIIGMIAPITDSPRDWGWRDWNATRKAVVIKNFGKRIKF